MSSVTVTVFAIPPGTALILAKMSHDKVTEGLKQLCAYQTEPLVKVSL